MKVRNANNAIQVFSNNNNNNNNKFSLFEALADARAKQST